MLGLLCIFVFFNSFYCSTVEIIESDSSSVFASFSDYVAKENEFYSKNQDKQNDLLVFISHDDQDHNEKLNQSVVLSMSSYFRSNFYCSLDHNPSLSSDCSGRDKKLNSRFTKPIRIVARKLRSNVGIKQLRQLTEQTQETYFRNNQARERYVLHGILIIGPTNIVTMFNLLLSSLNVSVIALDTQTFSLRLNNSQSVSRKGSFYHTSPNMRHFIDIADNFRLMTKLEDVNIYVSKAREKAAILQNRNSFPFIKSVEHVHELVKALNAASDTQSIHKSKKKTHRRFTVPHRHFRASHFIQPIINSHDLLLIKCSLNDLKTIVYLYYTLKDRYYSNDLLLANATSIKFSRYIVWIPEHSSINAKSVVNKLNRRGVLKVYVLNWHLDLDSALNTIKDQIISNKFHDYSYAFKSVARFTLELMSSYQDLRSSNSLNRLQFKLNDNQVIKDRVDLFNPNKIHRTDTRPSRKIYRIVSNKIEPFVIVSQLDEHLVSKDECKDGLPCLDIESSVYNDKLKRNNASSEMLRDLFRREQTISLIHNFKYFTETEEIELNKRVKTKCCTGYIINLLQRMAQDLDFEFEFYFFSTSVTSQADDEREAINHVIKEVAHMAAGPFSLSEEKLKAIDFSMPFLNSGYALLIKQEKRGVDDLFMFMKPFTYLHWSIIGLFALASAISLALLEFNSPFGLNPKGRQRARNYTLGSAISMVISLMFMHTMPAKSPKSWAGKWTQNFIASFALIFIATYTAQMASILSAGQESKVFHGIDDHELLKLKRGFIKNSPIHKLICSNRKRHYKSHCENGIAVLSDEAGIQSVMNGSLDVYISDQILLNYLRFKETNCNLKITGQNFAQTGYAFALSNQLKEKEKKDINIQILDYFETGFLDELYNKWFNKRVKCNKKGSDDKIRIDVEQYWGVYAYLGIGILAAILVLFLEQALYKWTIPFLRSKPKKSNWASLKLMFISQRFYRIVHSEELFTATDSAKEFINVFKRRDFEAIFQKSFRKKQMETLNNSQLRKRPKLWALIEASTERSRDVLNKSSDSSEEAKQEENSSNGSIEVPETAGAVNMLTQTMSKDQIIILKELCSPKSDELSKQLNFNFNPTDVSSNQEEKKAVKTTPNDDSISIEETCLCNENVNKMIESELNTSLVGSKGEFDENIFLADVSTPALDEPEIFNICGSSMSLLTTRRAERFDQLCSNQLTEAESNRLREYRYIHRMFANKSQSENSENS